MSVQFKFTINIIILKDNKQHYIVKIIIFTIRFLYKLVATHDNQSQVNECAVTASNKQLEGNCYVEEHRARMCRNVWSGNLKALSFANISLTFNASTA